MGPIFDCQINGWSYWFNQCWLVKINRSTWIDYVMDGTIPWNRSSGWRRMELSEWWQIRMKLVMMAIWFESSQNFDITEGLEFIEASSSRISSGDCQRTIARETNNRWTCNLVLGFILLVALTQLCFQGGNDIQQTFKDILLGHLPADGFGLAMRTDFKFTDWCTTRGTWL